MAFQKQVLIWQHKNEAGLNRLLVIFNAWERILKCLLNYNKIGQIIQANFVHWVILYRFGPRRYFLFFYLDFYEAKSQQDYSLGVDMKLLSSLVCWSTMFNGHICKQ